MNIKESLDSSSPRKTIGNLDYKKMLEAIEPLVCNDFCGEMELKTLPHSSPFTQKEAETMEEIIGRVFMVAHAIHCEACSSHWKIAPKKRKQKSPPNPL